MEMAQGRRAVLGVVVAVLPFAVAPVPAKAARAHCIMKSADGTGYSLKAAKFQVFEGILQATDTGVWAAWMVDGSTPGYKIGAVKYTCRSGSGLGETCRGTAKICKL